MIHLAARRDGAASLVTPSGFSFLSLAALRSIAETTSPSDALRA
jgi:hypothetical protein